MPVSPHLTAIADHLAHLTPEDTTRALHLAEGRHTAHLLADFADWLRPIAAQHVPGARLHSALFNAFHDGNGPCFDESVVTIRHGEDDETVIDLTGTPAQDWLHRLASEQFEDGAQLSVPLTPATPPATPPIPDCALEGVRAAVHQVRQLCNELHLPAELADFLVHTAEQPPATPPPLPRGRFRAVTAAGETAEQVLCAECGNPTVRAGLNEPASLAVLTQIADNHRCLPRIEPDQPTATPAGAPAPAGPYDPPPGTEYRFVLSDYARETARVLGPGWAAESGFLGAYGLIFGPGTELRLYVDDDGDLMLCRTNGTPGDAHHVPTVDLPDGPPTTPAELGVWAEQIAATIRTAYRP